MDLVAMKEALSFGQGQQYDFQFDSGGWKNMIRDWHHFWHIIQIWKVEFFFSLRRQGVRCNSGTRI